MRGLYFGSWSARLTAVQMHYCDPFCPGCVVCLMLRLLDLVQEWMQLVVDGLDLVCTIFRWHQDWTIRCCEEGMGFCLHSFGRSNLS